MDLASLIPHTSNCNAAKAKESGPFGVPNTLMNGFEGVRSSLSASHPLELSEKVYKTHRQQMDYAIVKSAQGSHAPLRLQFERNAAAKVQRLPFLASSNAMLQTLEGTDELIQFEDVLNDPTTPEVMGLPHMMVEKQLGLI